MVEIHRKVLEEITFVRVVTVAKHCFVFKVFLVMPQLVLNIRKLRVKLVLFGLHGRIEAFVSCHIRLIVGALLSIGAATKSVSLLSRTKATDQGDLAIFKKLTL